jgi:hypothetical protein
MDWTTFSVDVDFSVDGEFSVDSELPDKIRNTGYVLLLTESLPARRRGGRRCLKTCVATTRRGS